MTATRRVMAGLALVCFGNLLFSILLTRLFSATMFYHFTFLAVSLAMFGVAASGVYVFVQGDRLVRDVEGTLVWACNWFAVTTVVATVYVLANPIDILFYFGTSRVPEFEARQFWQLVLLVMVSAAPFFFSGVVVSLCITVYSRNIGSVYFADLAGAALAALVAGVVLGLLGGPSALLLVAVVALAARLLFRPSKGGWIAAAAMVAAVAVNTAVPFVTVPSGKGVAADKVAFEAWNIFSRVTVDQSANVKIDASAATQIVDLRTFRAGRQRVEITALAHTAFADGAERVLVIGPGGGRDVLHALEAGARHVTGVELNPIIVDDVMKGAYAERSGRLYFDPRVRVVVDDGRSYVRRSTARFDVIQASLVDTFAATAAGAFALSENTLYTREAFADYYRHLTDRGVLTMTRWHSGSEANRLLVLAMAGLEDVGVPAGKARAHIYYAVSPKAQLGTLIASRQPLDAGALDRLDAVLAAQGWTALVSPRGDGTRAEERLIDGGSAGPLVTGAREDISAPTDDRPFFFYYKRPERLFRFSGALKMSDPSLWLAVSLGAVLALALAFIVLPLVVRAFRRGVDSGEPAADKLLILGYFGLVGFAFMAVEIGLLQRMTLFLGHPSYSLVVVLFTLLLSTAIGAYLSGRIPLRHAHVVTAAGGVVLAVLALYQAYGLLDTIHSLIHHSLPVRVVLAAVIMAPAGIVMGAMIPTMVRVLGHASSRLVPWGWGVNGATSVLGTVASTVLAIIGGFSLTFTVGAALYALAGLTGLVAIRRLTRLAAPTPAQAQPAVEASEASR